MLLKTLVVIFIRINYVYNCEESQSDVTDTSYVSGEYLNIFKAIPALFEYVLDLIEHKPGILEKDDITVFTDDSSDMIDEIVALDDNIENVDSEINDEGLLRLDVAWNWYPGVGDGKRFDLSPTEVAEKTLEVEKQLEEYNDNKSRT